MKKLLLPAGLFFIPMMAAMASAPLTESTFTEIIREAKVLAAADKSVATAKTNMVFHAPDKVRTGNASRVEMTAPDKTITRIGANTVFTFEEGGRNILLEKGSLLFHAPAGAGGGSVRYRGTTAAVLGTTMICAVLPDHSFKVLDLEGEVKVTLKNNLVIILKAGEMVVVPPDEESFRPIEVFNIEKTISRLVLVIGFSDPLSSLPLILAAAQKQNAEIINGTIPFIIGFDQVVFGIDIVHHFMDPGLPHPPETPDRTQVPVSRSLP
jgi:hypothetical protein